MAPFHPGQYLAAVESLEAPSLRVQARGETGPRLEFIEPVELASNENPLGPAPQVSRLLLERMGRVNRYPEKDCAATEARIARSLEMDAANVVVGPGAFGVL